MATSTSRRGISPQRFRRITLIALWSLCAIVVTGAAVRLTGSGLGCSDWPTCEEDQLIPAWGFHAWIEFGNRLITGVVSVAVILAVLGSRWRRPRRRDLDLLAWGLVIGVVAQVIVGAFTVFWHLPPGIVMVHFLLSMVLVGNATLLWQRSAEDPAGDGSAPVARRSVLSQTSQRLVDAMAVWIWVVVITGTVVTASGPHGGDERADRLGFDIGEVTRIHGLSVVVFVSGLIYLLWRLRNEEAPSSVIRAAELVLLVALSQAMVGYVQYFNDIPAGLVAIHIAGATALFVTVVRLWCQSRRPLASRHDAEALSLA